MRSPQLIAISPIVRQFCLQHPPRPQPPQSRPSAVPPLGHRTMRHFLLFAALAALLACASANNHVCNSGWQDLIEPSANGKTYGNPHGEPRAATAVALPPVLLACRIQCVGACPSSTATTCAPTAATVHLLHHPPLPLLTALAPSHPSPPSPPPLLCSPAADAMFAAAMTAGVASKGCGLLSATKYEACYSSGAFLRSRTVAGEWGFGGQLKVFCPNKNAPETWNALAVADVKGSKWELTGELGAAGWRNFNSMQNMLHALNGWAGL